MKTKKQTKGKEKKFKVRVCPKCKSRDVGVVIGAVGLWECRSCKNKGKEFPEIEVSEEEFLNYSEKIKASD